jgi:hypothetical protein
MRTSERARAVEPESAAAAQPRLGPPAYVLLPVFALLAFLMTFRSVARFDTHVVGNSGDPLLILWILGWVQHAIPDGWGAVWNTSMFFPHENTLAFSDSMVSVALVDWPLRVLFGQVVSLNLLALAAQTASLWFMYRLTLRLTRSWPASVVASLAFTFSTVLLSHVAFYQLTLTAFLVPLTLLLLVRYLETWRLRYGIGIGLAFAALTTSATYFGLMMACAIPVVVIGYVILYRPADVRRFVSGFVAGALVAIAITIPVALQYMQLQDDSYFRRSFDAEVAAHPSDLLSPSIDNYALTEVWPLEQHAYDRSVENRLFPGIVATAFGVVGILVMVRGAGRDRGGRAVATRTPGPPPADHRWRCRIGLLIAGAGLLCLVLAFGDEMYLGSLTVPLPFRFLRRFVPGFSGIRATSRFAVMAACALALCSGFGVAAALRRSTRRVAAAVFVVLCAFVIVETAVKIPMVRVPEGETAEAVPDFLDDRPPGVVVELPVRGLADGAVWPYVESPRQLVSLGHDHERINGYSGYAPEGFDDVAHTLNEFPSPASLREMDRLDVRYVVLRTRVLGEQVTPFDVTLQEDGVGRFTPATARERIAEIPPARVRRVTRVPGAYIVELRPPR